jgi:hypothetical protein
MDFRDRCELRSIETSKLAINTKTPNSEIPRSIRFTFTHGNLLISQIHTLGDVSRLFGGAAEEVHDG